MARPRSHGDATARALLDAAERIVQDDGLAALSVRRAAAATGTSTRAVYSIFGSKDGLVAALAASGFDGLGADVAALPVTDDPVTDAVRAGAECFRRFTLGHPALFRIAFAREAVAPDVVVRYDAARRRALAQLTARLERVCEQRGLATSAIEAALPFHAMCEGLASLELRDALGPDPAAAWATSLRAVVCGLA